MWQNRLKYLVNKPRSLLYKLATITFANLNFLKREMGLTTTSLGMNNKLITKNETISFSNIKNIQKYEAFQIFKDPK